MRWLFRLRNGGEIRLLFCQWKLERYKAKGFTGFIHNGVFPGDEAYDIYIFPKEKNHGDFIT